MPFIKISTLRNKLNKAEIMKQVENALYTTEIKDEKLVPKGMATCIWQTQDCVVHELIAHQDFDPKSVEIPVFVDLYVNTMFTTEKMGRIMEVIADELSKGTGANHKYIFIQIHMGNPGYVFINGKVWNG